VRGKLIADSGWIPASAGMTKEVCYEVELGESDYDFAGAFNNPVCQLYAEDKSAGT